MLLFLLACAAHHPSGELGIPKEAELRARCGHGDINTCTLLIGLLEMEAFGPSRTVEAWRLAIATEGVEAAAQAVLLAEDRRDRLGKNERVKSWEQLCDRGYLPGCEVGARALRADAPVDATRLAETGCKAGWVVSCGPVEGQTVEVPPDFTAAVEKAGAELWVPTGFHVIPPIGRAQFSLASDDGRVEVGYAVGEDAVPTDREDLINGLLLTTGMNLSQRMATTDLRAAPFPAFGVRVEYNANVGWTGSYLAGDTQVLVVWVRRDPGTSLWMFLTFQDPSIVEDRLTDVGHSLRFRDPIGFGGSW